MTMNKTTLFDDLLYRSLTPFRNFLSLWILPYSKAGLAFYSSSQGELLWALASLCLAKVRQEGRGKNTKKLKTVYQLRLLLVAGMYIWARKSVDSDMADTIAVGKLHPLPAKKDTSIRERKEVESGRNAMGWENKQKEALVWVLMLFH